MAFLRALEAIVGDSRTALALADRVACEIDALPPEVRSSIGVFQLREAAISLAEETMAQMRREFFRTEVFPRATERLTEFPVSADGTIGLPAPARGVVRFEQHALGDVSVDLFNSDELSFARYADIVPNSTWIRNLVGPEWLFFPSATGHFFPDFIVLWEPAESGRYRRALFVETKGAHLMGNDDTEAKREACDGFSSALANVSFLLGSPADCQARVAAILGQSTATGDS